jgi:hypothetical protein
MCGVKKGNSARKEVSAARDLVGVILLPEFAGL